MSAESREAENTATRPPRIPPKSFRDDQRAWLDKLGLLDRPWLILGSAPNPTLPADILKTHARIDINNAGRFATEQGLGVADLTFRSKTRAWSEYPNLRTRGLVWFHSAPYPLMWLRLLTLPHVQVQSLMRVRRYERDSTVETVAGVSPADSGGSVGKATNGVAAICYAILMDVPEIVVAGFSLTRDGHSHDALVRKRHQVAEDKFILDRLKNLSNLSTTEAEFSANSGLRLKTS